MRCLPFGPGSIGRRGNSAGRFCNSGCRRPGGIERRLLLQLRLARTIRQTGLLRRAGALRQAILFWQAGLTLWVGARIDARISIRILLALNAALRDDPAADALRGAVRSGN